MRAVGATIIGLALLSACASASPALPSASGAAQPSAPAACEGAELNDPNGASINLTGRWRSPDTGNYYLRQVGSCVWFAGFSGDSDVPGTFDTHIGTPEWTNSFFGHLASDFTLRGSWADLPWGVDTGFGELGWQLTFPEVDGELAPTLVVIDATGEFGTRYLVVPDARVDLTVRLDDTAECLAVVAEDGEEYEFARPLGWTVANPLSLYGSDGEVIRPSDAFEVLGEVGRGEGECGPGHILFADQIVVPATP